MSKIIIDSNNQIVGIDIPVGFNQYSLDVDVEGLKKVLQQDAQLPKLDTEGNVLYVLAQPDLELTSTVTKQVETIVETGNEPIFVDVVKYIPMLDPVTGVQKTYQPTQVVDVYDDEGNVTGQETVNVGAPLLLQTTEVVQEQKKDADGKLLYWKTVEETVVTMQPQEPKLITSDSPEWTEELSQAFETIKSGTEVSVAQYPTLFTVDEVQNYPTLEQVKQTKLDQLNDACNKFILAGFTSDALGEENHYDFDYEAQINMGGTLNGITAGMITGDIMWKTAEGNKPHTVNQFKQLYADGMTFKQTNIAKYWTLKNQVLACETRADVAAIQW
ncbi:DUF4376 domain-containing protein [Paenibacillus cremeus]|uniref:DUF4376 domain-containing protein n=1 Tax=Paenibacillus cremeus TaxID=2163881 RepID=A0A559KCY5_9BACL|nr:DUF4376 domain-containing protein [Paenibacillus cremeus]TVY09990.1 DUF4376 domain-containing protein [Paenibacillus cremeus]